LVPVTPTGTIRRHDPIDPGSIAIAPSAFNSIVSVGASGGSTSLGFERFLINEEGWLCKLLADFAQVDAGQQGLPCSAPVIFSAFLNPLRKDAPRLDLFRRQPLSPSPSVREVRVAAGNAFGPSHGVSGTQYSVSGCSPESTYRCAFAVGKVTTL
jgi:hypothetical protein